MSESSRLAAPVKRRPEEGPGGAPEEGPGRHAGPVGASPAGQLAKSGRAARAAAVRPLGSSQSSWRPSGVRSR